MTSQKQKHMERKIIEAFKQQYEDFPPGKIQESEKPDFLVVDGNYITGIELTEYHHNYGSDSGDTIRQANVSWFEIIKNAQAEFESTYPEFSVWVSVNLNVLSKPVTRNMKQVYVSALVKIVTEVCLSGERELKPDKRFAMCHEGAEQLLRGFVSINRMDLDSSQWSYIDVFGIPSPMHRSKIIDTLANVVRVKEQKLEGYKKTM